MFHKSYTYVRPKPSLEQSASVQPMLESAFFDDLPLAGSSKKKGTFTLSSTNVPKKDRDTAKIEHLEWKM